MNKHLPWFYRHMATGIAIKSQEILDYHSSRHSGDKRTVAFIPYGTKGDAKQRADLIVAAVNAYNPAPKKTLTQKIKELLWA